jgi:hypothetical protein
MRPTPEQWVNWYDSSFEKPCPGCGKSIKDRRKHLEYCAKKNISAIRKELSPVPCYFHDQPTDCIPTKPNRCRKAAVDTYIKKLNEVAKDEIEKLKKKLQTLDCATREYEDSTVMLGSLRSVTLGKPITKDQYMQKGRKTSPEEFIFCSREEAMDILTHGPPLLPIIIPPAPMTEEDCRLFIRARNMIIEMIKDTQWVDVYDSGKKLHNRIPEKMTGFQAVNRFYSDDQPSINALNNRISKEGDNHWMESIPGYGMVRWVVEQAKGEGVDLTSFAAVLRVWLLASRGADTHWHVDHNGVTTGILLWMGSKLWLVSCDPSGKKLQDFAVTKECPQNPSVILIDEGYELIQPPMTIHSVHTCQRSLTECNMYPDSRTMPTILKQTRLELEHDHITNDDHHKDLGQVLDRLMVEWEIAVKMNQAEAWPEEEYLGEAKRDELVCYVTILQINS